MTIEPKFTLDEGNQLLSLIDLAVKAGGLQVAQIALPLVAKLQEAAAQVEPVQAVPDIEEAA